MNIEDIKLEIIEQEPERTSVGNEESEGLIDVWEGECGGHDEHPEIARRLVAAWTYCAGIPTSELESKGADAGFWGRACARLGTERDKLKVENAALHAAIKEMQRFLPVLEHVENDIPKMWECLTMGTGIPNLNNYRQTLEKAMAQMEIKPAQ